MKSAPAYPKAQKSWNPAGWLSSWKAFLASDLRALILVGLIWLVFLTLVSAIASRQYGFHRDELAFIDNGRNLDWGFVEYPPLVPFLARIALALFGLSVVGFRLFPAIAVSAILVLAGLMTRELGGSRRAQITTGLVVVSAPLLLSNGLFFSYETFDYLWWVLAALLLLRLLKSQDPRWWLGIGAVVGLGMLTKYTMAFCVLGIAVGVLLTPARRFLKSPWLWAGVALALLIWLPNLIWQGQHQFIGLRFTGSIHERDIRLGRTNDFLISQLFVNNNLAAIDLWTTGVWYFGFQSQGRRYRLFTILAVFLFLVFWLARGRFYYLAPVYPMLMAGGRVWSERPRSAPPVQKKISSPTLRYSVLVVSSLLMLAISLPLAPVNSGWWRFNTSLNPEPREEIGWPELVGEVARIRDTIPAAQQSRLGILAGNYGEAGAVNLYGPAYGLPKAISGIDSYWLRGYGNPPPETLIVVGLDRETADHFFTGCQLAGHTFNRFGILNEETRDHPDLFVCHGPRQSWPEFWKNFQYFG